MNKFILLIFCIIFVGCSGGGKSAEPASDGSPSSGDSPNEQYSATYEYPENNLSPGDGRVLVDATRVVCKNSSGVTVDSSKCGGLSSSPKREYLSPAGSVFF